MDNMLPLTIQSVRSTIELNLRMVNLPLFTTLSDFGVDYKQMQELQRALNNIFKSNIELMAGDTIDSIHDKLLNIKTHI